MSQVAKRNTAIIVIPKLVIKALKQYYENRAFQASIPWNQKADLDNIDIACAKHSIGFIKIAGTFWFTRGKYTIKCNEGDYLTGGERSRTNSV